uniref:Cupin-like domain-containing protein n=1 Tax=Heliothis virescens TaxID=7102 RepID=A0A2A4IUH8_HELVI
MIAGLIFVLLISGRWVYTELLGSRSCILELPSFSKSVFRPPEDCSMCVGVDDVVRLANTTAEEFEDKYAYSTTPVIVTDATEGWKALREFDFNFFATFYSDGKMGKQINDCFYFAYKSGLNSLQEVFSMDEARANLSGQPWYVGWSTCYDDETRKLRSYYNRPYFLPKTAESDMVDWIFMGGPGQGAHMHVDSVRHMSWQAQVRGRKQWQLAPPPECLYTCRWISFTVAPGEILVVDTNRWYHKTNVLPGDISITIGAEYD